MKLSFSAFCLAVAAVSATTASSSVEAFIPHRHYERYQKPQQHQQQHEDHKTALYYVNSDDHSDVHHDLVDMAIIAIPRREEQPSRSTTTKNNTPEQQSIVAPAPTVVQMASFVVNQMSYILGFDNAADIETVAFAIAAADQQAPAAPAAAAAAAAPTSMKKPLPFFAKPAVEEMKVGDSSTSSTSVKKGWGLDDDASADHHHHHHPQNSSRQVPPVKKNDNMAKEEQPIPFFATRVVVPSKPAFTTSSQPVAASVSPILIEEEDAPTKNDSTSTSTFQGLLPPAFVLPTTTVVGEWSKMGESLFQNAFKASHTVWGSLVVSNTKAGAAALESSSSWSLLGTASSLVSELAREYAAKHDAARRSVPINLLLQQGRRLPPTPPMTPPKLELFDTASILQQVAEMTGSSASSLAKEETTTPAKSINNINNNNNKPPRQLGSGMIDFAEIDSLLMDIETALELADQQVLLSSSTSSSSSSSSN